MKRKYRIRYNGHHYRVQRRFGLIWWTCGEYSVMSGGGGSFDKHQWGSKEGAEFYINSKLSEVGRKKLWWTKWHWWKTV